MCLPVATSKVLRHLAVTRDALVVARVSALNHNGSGPTIQRHFRETFFSKRLFFYDMPSSSNNPSAASDLPSAAYELDAVELRRHFRRTRRSLSPQQQQVNANAVARGFFSSPFAWRRGVIAGYLPVDGELNPLPLLLRLAERGQPLALPVIERNVMTFRVWRPGDALVRNRFNIAEPRPQAPGVDTRAIAIMLTPLVAFDAQGSRLGMGAGFYDRHLGRIAPRLRPTLIGLAHSCQQAPRLPRHAWDIPLRVAITETSVLSFTA